MNFTTFLGLQRYISINIMYKILLAYNIYLVYASIWSLTAAAPSDSIFRALCTNSLTYLLTYLKCLE